MVAGKTKFILILLSIQFYIGIQAAVQQPADILGDNSKANKFHNKIDLVRNLMKIICAYISHKNQTKQCFTQPFW